MTPAEQCLQGLNEDQKAAVIDFEGPCFIVAGPGSGKTKVIVSRTDYMIKKGIDGESIILFTFTNKAASEIKERIIKAVGEDAGKLKVGTYHSVCNSFLRLYHKYTPYEKNFSIYDSDDSLALMKRIVKGYPVDPKIALDYISKKKDKLVKPDICIKNAETNFERILAQIYAEYQNELLKQNAMDFDDIICQMVYMLEANPEVKRMINTRYRYVTADEFHDSSPRDIKLMELLAGELKNICFILDNDQSIYSFRGADIEAVMGVQNIFNVKTFVLKENYRSTKNIIYGARTLIANNPSIISKEIHTNNEEGSPIMYFELDNRFDESIKISNLIIAMKKRFKFNYEDMAILYRASYLSRDVEEKLIKAGIPYQIVGGLPFFARKEIKDILSYARLIYNPFDFESFKRCVQSPKRGVSDVTIEKILNYSRDEYAQPINFIQACKEVELKGVAKTGIDSFNDILEQLIYDAEQDTAVEFIKHVVEYTDYKTMLHSNKDKKDGNLEDRLSNIIELEEIAYQFTSLEDMLQNSSLGNIEEDEESIDRVNLMTMHASKGLEFPIVFIVGACESICPYWRAETPKAIEEERRLFYVAMTRAEKHLFITSPRMIMNQGQTQRTSRSRFVNEIEKRYIQKN